MNQITCYEKLYQLEENNKCINSKCEFNNFCCSKNCALAQVIKDGNLTMESISQILGVSKMRICQIEKQTVEKIKKKIKNQNLS
jgi:DNA-directed RNA polymerase specialized sigma subunit